MRRVFCGYESRRKTEIERSAVGGAEGDRTPDLIIANDALSQLSYSPVRRMAHLWGAAMACQAACTQRRGFRTPHSLGRPASQPLGAMRFDLAGSIRNGYMSRSQRSL